MSDFAKEIFVQTRLPAALTISGSGNVGKTTLARLIVAQSAKHVQEGLTLLPYQLAEQDMRTQEMRNLVTAFGRTFLDGDALAAILTLADENEQVEISSHLEAMARSLANTYKRDVATALSMNDAPEKEIRKLAWTVIAADDSIVRTVMSSAESDQQTQGDVDLEKAEAIERLTGIRREMSSDDKAEASVSLLEAPKEALKRLEGDDGWQYLMSVALSSDLMVTAVSNNVDAREHLMLACITAAKVLRRVYGPTSCLRNEKKTRDPGLEISLHEAGENAYVIHFGEGDEVGDVTVIAEPLTLAKALGFFSVVHVTTLNSAFGSNIKYATTGAGGLSETVPMSIQTLNDIGANSGAHFVIELRDDYTPSSANEEVIRKFENRLSSSSRVALNLTQRGIGRIRLRGYASGEPEGTSGFTFDLEDFEAWDNDLKDVVWPSSAGPGKDSWSVIKEALEIDYREHSY